MPFKKEHGFSRQSYKIFIRIPFEIVDVFYCIFAESVILFMMYKEADSSPFYAF